MADLQALRNRIHGATAPLPIYFKDDHSVDYAAIENQLDFGKACAEGFLEAGERVGDWLTSDDETELESGRGIRAQGAMLRELHALLKEKDPGGKFGGLARVQNKRREFLWVHPQFAGEY